MKYQRITDINDSDIPYLSSILKSPEISRYISIDESNYWDYVTTTDNVFYFKVYNDKDLVAATHLEISNNILYMDIMVVPKYQNQGIASSILKDILSGILPPEFDYVEVSIDESNIASIRLFERFGFTRVSQEDELINYVYKVKQATV